MKDPQRLLDASASELELHLLRAGASEQPEAAALQRLAEKLGVGELSPPAASQLPPAAAKTAGLFTVGLVAVGMTLVGVAWLATRPLEQPAANEPTPLETPALQPAIGPSAIAVEAPPATQSLAQEIARIDAIRRLLAANGGQQTLTALEDYRRDFPSGVLQQESELLSIEAHRQTGDRRRARTLAARFLVSHPDSPHSARVRELLEALGPDAR
jgi:hypothetical protein